MMAIEILRNQLVSQILSASTLLLRNFIFSISSFRSSISDTFWFYNFWLFGSNFSILLFFCFTVIILDYMPSKKADQTSLAPPKRSDIHKVNDILSLIFHLIWIVIGLFILVLIYGQIRSGALSQAIGMGQPTGNYQSSAPTETDLPGIGRVNVDCVRTGLKPESIQKILESSSSAGLSADEKATLDKCIVTSSSPSPSQ